MRYARVTGFHYACVLTIKNWIGVRVYFCSDKPEQNKERYDFIEKNCKSQIDALNCKKVEWKRLDDKKVSYINVKLEADFRNQSDWQRQLDCMYNTMMEFHNIIKPHYNSTREIK